MPMRNALMPCMAMAMARAYRLFFYARDYRCNQSAVIG